MTIYTWDILLIGALSLNTYHTPSILDSPDAQDHAHADISYAYASIKLWLLLARKAAAEQPAVSASGGLQDFEGYTVKMVWNELWPPFESVIEAFEMDARAGSNSVSVNDTWGGTVGC